jgi:hypothetical protein
MASITKLRNTVTNDWDADEKTVVYLYSTKQRGINLSEKEFGDLENDNYCRLNMVCIDVDRAATDKFTRKA